MCVRRGTREWPKPGWPTTYQEPRCSDIPDTNNLTNYQEGYKCGNQEIYQEPEPYQEHMALIIGSTKSYWLTKILLVKNKKLLVWMRS